MTAVGISIRRIDGTEKVAGQALYTGDLRLPGMAIAKVLRSPVAHARIRGIDATKARAVPGVLAVLTRDNLNVASNAFGAYVRDQQILATERVRYVGDMVAAVAAIDDAVAAEAVKLIEVDYDELPAVYNVEEALADEAPLVHEKLENRKDPAMAGAAHTSSTSGATSVFIFATSAATWTAVFAKPIRSSRTVFIFPAPSTIRWSRTSAWRSSKAMCSPYGAQPRVRFRCARN